MSGIAIFMVLSQFCRAWGSTATYKQAFLEGTTKKLASRLSPVSKQALRGYTLEKYAQAQRRLTSHADGDVCKDPALHNCDCHATCISTVNNVTGIRDFSCECNPGFKFITTGFDGKQAKCMDVNECHTKQYECPANTRCVNTVGSYTCKCEKPDCHPATTSSTADEGDNQCKDPADNNCDCHATCKNIPDTPGMAGFDCECNPGYDGDGITCVKNSTEWTLVVVIGSAVVVVVIAITFSVVCRRKIRDAKTSLGPAEELALTCNTERSFGGKPTSMYMRMADNVNRSASPLCGSESTIAMLTLEQKTFATSHYKRVYNATQAPVFQHDLLGAVHRMLKLYAKRTNPALAQPALGTGVDEFMSQIQDDAFQNDNAMRNDVGALSEYLWTSAKTHRVVQFKQLCSVLNTVIRDDIEEEVEAAAIFFRGINTRRVTRVPKGNVDPSFPRNGETWRGGGFRSQHRAFFEGMVGKKYRVPGFLATSAKRSIAAKFAFDAFEDDSSHPCVIWRVTVDPRGKEHPEHRVKHMTFVSKTLVEGEEEYLFAPYSVFTLVSAEWSASLSKPHELTIRAAQDNKMEDEGLPLTPWY